MLLIVLLSAGVTAEAQSTGSDVDPRVDEKTGEKDDDTWSSDLKAPLRPPSDQVGGSWNVLFAYGRMTDAAFVEVLTFRWGWEEADLYTADIGYTLKEDNPLVRFFDPVLTTIDVAMNVTYQDDPAGDIFVFSPYIMARWSDFPWSKSLHTTFGLGAGFSYATDIPSIEINPAIPNGDYKRLMHYLAAEATVALTKKKDWHLVYRVHHRSGVFGLMQGDNAGNTAVQIGIRHYFK